MTDLIVWYARPIFVVICSLVLAFLIEKSVRQLVKSKGKVWRIHD